MEVFLQNQSRYLCGPVSALHIFEMQPAEHAIEGEGPLVSEMTF